MPGVMMNETQSHESLMRSIGHLAEAALPRWGIEGARLEMINHSENTTYRVTPPGGGRPVILRVHRPGYHTVDGIRSELAWMRALQAEGGVHTPQAIPALDGTDIQTVSDPSLATPRNCVLFAFIEGEEPRQDHDLIEPFKRLGEVTARTHLHSMRWQRPDFFERTVWDFEHSIGGKPNWGPWTEGPDMNPARLPLLQRLVDAMQRRLQRYGQGKDRYGLIHADFRLANLLIHKGDIRVIDFDDCGLGWFLYDAGTAVSFFEHRPEVPGLIDAWAEGYRRVRPLSKEDEAELPTFVILRRMILFAWMGSHAETDLAKQEGPAYAEGTCEMAEHYLSRFG
jgi:Ser/Thr protein kinase RdoA (MazF antagonist)